MKDELQALDTKVYIWLLARFTNDMYAISCLLLISFSIHVFCQNTLQIYHFPGGGQSMSSPVFLTENSKRDTCADDNPSCNGRIVYENGDVYEGEISYGAPHGKGVYKWTNGDKYTGEFIDGYREGWGIQELSDGGSYQGNWFMGYMEGEGHYEFSCGIEYSGGFYKDKMHGEGTLLLENGESFAGEWRNGLANGHGTYVFMDGSRFVGNYKKGNRHGKGVITWQTGETFTATWKKDRIQKEATIEFTNGDAYVCEFDNGIPTGEGFYLFPDGKVIEGDIEIIEIMLMKEETDLAVDMAPNFGFATYAMAMEFKMIEEYELASDNFKQAEAFLPDNSRFVNQIPSQMASISDEVAKQKMN